MQATNEESDESRDNTQYNARHHGCYHIVWDAHGLVTVTVWCQHFPPHAETDTLPAVLGKTSPSKAVDQFMNHNANNRKNKCDAPVAEGSKEFSEVVFASPYYKEWY